jgi:glycosyltransferase involved in cell wall biosynthesis
MLTNSFAPLSPGGAERQAEYLSSYLAGHGVAVTVVTRHVPPLPRFETKDGYNIIRIPQFGYGKIKTLTFVLGTIFTLILRRNSFDILHAHLVNSPAFAAVIAGKLIGKKAIVKFRSSGIGSDLKKSQKNLSGIVRMEVLRHLADAFIVLTNEMQDELISAGFSRHRVAHMYNGVDTEYYSSATNKNRMRDLPIPHDKILLLYTGRMDPSKNLSLLLMAVKKAIFHCPDLHLMLVGDGEEKGSLISLTDRLGLHSSVTFVGLATDVRDYLNAADIFVMSSSDEGISNSLLEAMSCGLACISTDVGGARDILNNGLCGILVEPNNVDEFSNSIVRLALDPVLMRRFGDLARQRVLDNYSINAIGESYIGLYNNIFSME